MATYAAIEDVRAYTKLAADVIDEELQDVLDRAERDVDGELVGDVLPATGLKYDPTVLEQWRSDALNRGVCAQTEYRLEMGEEFFIRAQHDRVSGPDFTTEGRLPYLGPKVRRELRGTRLLRTAAVSATLVSPYSGPDTTTVVDVSLPDLLLP